MSIDFTYPTASAAPYLANANPRGLVPLGMPEKRVMHKLDVVDENGGSLPVLTRDQNSTISAAMLILEAEGTLAAGGVGGLEQSVRRQLADICGMRRRGGDWPTEEMRLIRVRRALRRFVMAVDLPLLSEASAKWAQRRTLWSDDVMRGSILQLARRFVFFVEVGAQPGTRRIVKMSYQERVERDSSGQMARFLEGFGLRSFPTGFLTRGVFGADSYHAEIEVPTELVIKTAELGRVLVYRSRTGMGITTEVLSRESGVHLAHLFAGGRERVDPPDIPSDAVVDEMVGFIDLRLALRPGLLWPPFVISLATTGILAAGLALTAEGVATRPEAAAAIIVVLPAVAAAYLVPGEHHLVRRMYKALRLLVLCASGISFVAAATLALDLPHDVKVIWWKTLGGVSCTITVLLFAALAHSILAARNRPA